MSEPDLSAEAGPACVLGCLAVCLLLLLRTERASRVSGGLHGCKPRGAREVCASRSAACRRLPRTAHHGLTRGVCRTTLLLINHRGWGVVTPLAHMSSRMSSRMSRGLRSIALYLLVSAHSSEASHSSDATVYSNVPSACDGSGNIFGAWGYLIAPLPDPPCGTNERGAAEGVATCFSGNPNPLTLTLTLTPTPTQALTDWREYRTVGRPIVIERTDHPWEAYQQVDVRSRCASYTGLQPQTSSPQTDPLD